MAARIDDPRRAELAQIHIAKNQLGLDDDTYRAMLWTIARVRSAADLDFTGRKQVLGHLRQRGFQTTPPDSSLLKPHARAAGTLRPGASCTRTSPRS